MAVLPGNMAGTYEFTRMSIVTLHDVLERRKTCIPQAFFLPIKVSTVAPCQNMLHMGALKQVQKIFNSLASLINHGLISFSSIKPLRKEVATAAEQSDYRQVKPTTFRKRGSQERPHVKFLPIVGIQTAHFEESKKRHTGVLTCNQHNVDVYRRFASTHAMWIPGIFKQRYALDRLTAIQSRGVAFEGACYDASSLSRFLAHAWSSYTSDAFEERPQRLANTCNRNCNYVTGSP